MQETRARDVKRKGNLVFWSELLRSPHSVSAVAPSSKPLARLITSALEGSPGPVIELGPGTGVFTRALLERGVPECRLGLVEMNERFCARLRGIYPEAQVRQARAEHVARLDFGFEDRPLAVISGLPLLSFSPRSRYQILSSAFSMLGEAGAFYQFTYGFHCPVSDRILRRLGLGAHRIGTVFANVPPASVYRFERVSV